MIAIVIPWLCPVRRQIMSEMNLFVTLLGEDGKELMSHCVRGSAGGWRDRSAPRMKNK